MLTSFSKASLELYDLKTLIQTSIFTLDFQIIKPFWLVNPGENGENIVYVNSATKDLEFSASSNVDGSQGNKLGRHRELSILMSSLLSMLE